MITAGPRLHDLFSGVLREYSKLQAAVQVLRNISEDSNDDAFHGVVFLLEDTIENMKGLGDQIDGIIREVRS